jgi:hypothetical protein
LAGGSAVSDKYVAAFPGIAQKMNPHDFHAVGNAWLNCGQPGLRIEGIKSQEDLCFSIVRSLFRIFLFRLSKGIFSHIFRHICQASPIVFWEATVAGLSFGTYQLFSRVRLTRR